MEGSGTGATRPEIRLSIDGKEDAPLVAGRRRSFRHLDIGLSDTVGARPRARVVTAISGVIEPTGWHTQRREARFVHTLRGRVELEFGDGTRTRSGPGGVRRNEIDTSDDPEVLELSIAGDTATRPCDPSPGPGRAAVEG